MLRGAPPLEGPPPRELPGEGARSTPDGGCGTLVREPISGVAGRPWFSGRADGIATLDRGPFVGALFMPRSFGKPPALGGRGTLREAMGRPSGIRMLLVGLAPRFGVLSAGRCTPLLSDVGPWFRPKFGFRFASDPGP